MKNYKHIFLEGPSKAGKSTIIRECIAPYADIIGGISCKRYVDEHGTPRAYGLAAPGDFNVNGRFSLNLHGNPEQGISPKDASIFMIYQKGKPYMDIGVFDLLGTEMLKASRNSKLVLLDEIGGIELLSENFRRELYHILEGDYHCIGVIKQIDKNKAPHLRGELSTRRDDYNYRLRRDLVEKFESKIIKYEYKNKGDVQEEIKAFLERNAGL